jgi:hypothetical protein
MANHSPGDVLRVVQGSSRVNEQQPACKEKPNGKFMDDEDFNRRMAIKARDPDRFVKLSMSYYCPSLIMEREA